jgi:hypothetical protein
MSAPAEHIEQDLYVTNTLNEKLLHVGVTGPQGSHASHASHASHRDSLMGSMPPDYKRTSLNELATREFYQQDVCHMYHNNRLS